MRSKFIYAKTRDGFERHLPNIPQGLDPIAFIEDSNQIWVMGKYFSIGSPSVIVSERDNSIDVNIGDEKFNMSAAGDNLNIRKGSGNNIIFSSAALTAIKTDYPLSWDAVEKKLSHSESGVTAGAYGETSSSDNVNLITVPRIIVDKWGHLTTASNINLKIRDYVEQLNTSGLSGKFRLLVAGTTSPLDEANITRKSTMEYDADTGILHAPEGIQSGTINVVGDVVVIEGKIKGDVEGSITGTAKPKIHISEDPEYGGASIHTYGHVKLQDNLVMAPPASSDNTDVNNDKVQAVAASPKMVWDEKVKLEKKIDDLPLIEEIVINGEGVDVSELGGSLGIKVEGGITATIDEGSKEITFRSTSITGFGKNNIKTQLLNNMDLSQDFEVDNGSVYLRWVNTN